MCYSVKIGSMQPFQDVCFLDGTYGRFKLGILQKAWLAYLWNTRTEQDNREGEDGLYARRRRVRRGSASSKTASQAFSRSSGGEPCLHKKHFTFVRTLATWP